MLEKPQTKQAYQTSDNISKNIYNVKISTRKKVKLHKFYRNSVGNRE